ncbi:MAG TPA: hypothetical protein VHA70_05905 [Bauldia sp.]|nr:hypothetical protein [Bauldia sp.]
MARRGIVYACSSERWFPEVLVSVESARHHMPDLSRHLFLTRDLNAKVASQLKGLFTDVVVLDHAEHDHRPRFEAALRAEVDEGIYIDGDTLFLAPVYELFDILGPFDIGLAAAPQYISPLAMRMGVIDRLPKTPIAIPEWNGGLMVARADDGFRKFLADWMALFADCMKMGLRLDQPALRVALVRSGLRIATLPNNYNFRALVPQNVAGMVKILHAHGELKRIGATINASQGMRLFVPKPDDLHGYHPPQ